MTDGASSVPAGVINYLHIPKQMNPNKLDTGMPRGSRADWTFKSLHSAILGGGGLADWSFASSFHKELRQQILFLKGLTQVVVKTFLEKLFALPGLAVGREGDDPKLPVFWIGA